jgi:excisionase family DNA binding protein/PAS domain S-box-containing protein
MQRTLYSTPELAGWLGVFHKTVRRWIERGRIRGIRIGRNYKIPVHEVVRILEEHQIPLPDEVSRYRNVQQKTKKAFVSPNGSSGSLLRKMLIVEEMAAPAFVCRKETILGGNRAFADLVGYSQADLIGLNLADVLEESSEERLTDFAERRTESPEKSPSDYQAYLKVSDNRKKRVSITAGNLDNLKNIYLLCVRSYNDPMIPGG